MGLIPHNGAPQYSITGGRWDYRWTVLTAFK
jgi:hypothetical protein